MSIRLLLADDHGIMRESLRALLDKRDDMEVVAEAENGRVSVELAGKLLPDVVIMDVIMGGLNGIEATRLITSRFPEVKVIALSMHSKRRFIAEMLSAGAAGYVLKECLFQELVQAIRAVVANGSYLSPKITGVVVEDYVRCLKTTDDSTLATLTGREREVLQLVAEGRATKQIALELHVSVKTVEANRRKIMEKLDAHSVAELTRFAVREGLTALNP